MKDKKEVMINRYGVRSMDNFKNPRMDGYCKSDSLLRSSCRNVGEDQDEDEDRTVKADVTVSL